MEYEVRGMMDYSDPPSVLVLADAESAGSRARHSAERAGGRAEDVVPLAGAMERLDREAGTGAVLAEVERDEGAIFRQLLDGMKQLAAQQKEASIVAGPIELVDAIAVHAPDELVRFLCDAVEADRVAAIAPGVAPRQHWLHDVGKEEGLPGLQQVSEEIGRIANILAALAERQESQTSGASQPTHAEDRPRPVDAGWVRAIIRARRLRDQYLGSDLFADPAWDILLDLYAASLEDQRVAVSSLCIAAAVPATTALRWIKTLTDLGLLVRAADPQDGRRVYIELAPKARAGLDAYLQAAQRISPLIL